MNGYVSRLLFAGILSAAAFVGALALGVGQVRDADQRQAWTRESVETGTVLR